MQITNKRLAFYVALIALVAVVGLVITEHISNEQAAIFIPPMLLFFAYFMGLDALWDYINVIFRVADFVTKLTPTTKDDEALVELRNVVRIVQETNVPNMEDSNEVGLGG